MNKKILALVLLLAAVFCAAAADAPTVTTTFFRFQCDPAFSSDGATLTSAPVQAFWKASAVVDGVTYDAPMQSVAWDAAGTAKTVTIHVASTNSDVTLTDAEVLAAVLAAANREKAAQAQ